ncbi:MULTISPECIES: medium chain dehydrogenase/reductase family protein [unclassified Wenzhouxiangella]|uniref:synaptic vesicle VAT-1 family membrane protein n=1 Tax=unclassified Wenzhouxiangella TaxID=2613841 RepID=UPI000E32734A|nr:MULTISPECIES: medium chain dehydrogenase/reductase family protein [unclassified Wenzhouxiangella]RFF28206.1 zinc-binding dehydrogenase [Wenzhouxiangella sp. 15181]RFP67990.1 zinc-binding dehydrogenase [Wenzhouxiangella sp. 15190]
MHRIVIQRPGGLDTLQLLEESVPEPAPGEVVIACRACGVNYADSIIRMGLYASAKKLHGYPITPGFEVAGTVAAVGEKVEHWQPGDEVIGLSLFSGYASHLRLPAEGVFAKPAALSFEQAATVPTVFLTAWWMVHRQVHPRPGETWLVHSAAGGVGSALLQLARLADVQAIGVVGATHKVEHARSMGAQAVIDKSAGELWREAEHLAPEGFDAVFDANGVATLKQSYEHLAPTGRLVIYGFASMLPKNGRLNWFKLARDWLRTPRFNPMDMTQSNRSVLAANLSFLQSHAPAMREGMQWLLERFADSRLAPLPVETFALNDAANAQRRIESGQTIGKLALIP